MQLKIYTDGGARGNPGPAGIGVYAIDQTNQEVYSQSSYIGEATNNVAEYRAFEASLDWLQRYLDNNAVESVTWCLDSMLVVEQLQRHWKIKEAHLQLLAHNIWQKMSTLKVSYIIRHVPRAQNKIADLLVNRALDAELGN